MDGRFNVYKHHTKKNTLGVLWSGGEEWNAAGMDDIIAATAVAALHTCAESIINLKVEFFQWKLKKQKYLIEMEWRRQEKPWMCQFCALGEWLKQKLSSGSTKIPSVIYFSCALSFGSGMEGVCACRLTWSFIYRRISEFNCLSLKYEALEFQKDHYFVLKYLRASFSQ